MTGPGGRTATGDGHRLDAARRQRRNVAAMLAVCVCAAATVDGLFTLVVLAYAAYAITRPLEQYRPTSVAQARRQVAAMRARGQWW